MENVRKDLITPWRSLISIGAGFIKVEKLIVERKSIVSNYNEQETNMLVGAYLDKPTAETVEELALHLNRSKKSIIGKLSREGVYRREVYVSKTGEVPITKSEIVENIATHLGIEVEDISGLEKAPKAALKRLEGALS